MLDQIRNVICQYVEINPEEISESTQLIEDLGINSYDLVAMIATVEDEFGIVIPDRDILGFVTVGDVLEYLDENA